jgi:hypothetical protein
MADESLERFEAALGAIAKITSEGDSELVGARCPKCEASDFARVADLFAEAVDRIEENPDSAKAVGVGGLTDLQIVQKFRPPRRKSPVPLVIATAIPLGAGAFYLYQHYSDTIGQAAIIAAIVIVVMVFLTSLRRLGDRYYHDRRRWRSLFMCRKCGQLVAS